MSELQKNDTSDINSQIHVVTMMVLKGRAFIPVESVASGTSDEVRVRFRTLPTANSGASGVIPVFSSLDRAVEFGYSQLEIVSPRLQDVVEGLADNIAFMFNPGTSTAFPVLVSSLRELITGIINVAAAKIPVDLVDI